MTKYRIMPQVSGLFPTWAKLYSVEKWHWFRWVTICPNLSKEEAQEFVKESIEGENA